MKSYLFSASTLALAAVLTLPARAGTRISLDLHIGPPTPLIVESAPPRPVVERMVVSPGPGYLWVAGHYSWSGRQWVWIPGAWYMPPQPGAVWVEARWDHRTHNWIEGYWSIPPAPQVVVMEAPPAPRSEVIMVRPSLNHVWIAGYWVWRGHRHEWVSGHWELPPQGHRNWVAPRWEHHGGSYVFVEGRWN